MGLARVGGRGCLGGGALMYVRTSPTLSGMGAWESPGGGMTPIGAATDRTNPSPPGQVYYVPITMPSLPNAANQPANSIGISFNGTLDQYFAQNMPGWYVSGKGFPYFLDYQGQPIAFDPTDPLNLSGRLPSGSNLVAWAYQASDVTYGNVNYPYNSLLQQLQNAVGNFTTVETTILCNKFNIATGIDCATGKTGNLFYSSDGTFNPAPWFPLSSKIDWTVPLINSQTGQIDANYNDPSLIPPDVAAAFGFTSGNPNTANVTLTPWDGTIGYPSQTKIQAAIASLKANASGSSAAPLANAEIFQAQVGGDAYTQAQNAIIAAMGGPNAQNNAAPSPGASSPQAPAASASSTAAPAAATNSGATYAPPVANPMTPAPTPASSASSSTAEIVSSTTSMLDDFTSWIQTNPLLAGGIAVGVFFMFSGGGKR